MLLVWFFAIEPPARPPGCALVGVSQALDEVLEQIALAASKAITVLLLGETGVGKELLTRGVHRLSGCRGASVAFNCGGLAEGVLQSELFGHARGPLHQVEAASFA